MMPTKPTMESSFESSWYQLCLSYYEHTDAEGLRALEYFHRLDPDTLQQQGQSSMSSTSNSGGHYGGGRGTELEEAHHTSAHGSDLALLGIRAADSLPGDADYIALMVKCGFHPPHAFTREHWQRYNDIKNQARSEAHRLGMSRRIESTRTYITTVAAQTASRSPSYGDISALMVSFLRSNGGDIGLLSFLHGMHRWLLSHLPPAESITANTSTTHTTTHTTTTTTAAATRVCMQWTVPGETFSERSAEFTADACQLLLSLGQLSSTSAADVESGGDYAFTWILRPHLSDAYLIRLGKTIRNRTDLGNMKHALGVISPSSVPRTNVDGSLDDFVPYVVNKLSCPIL